jgi:hypothetical protein
VILWISASHIVRIIGVNHQHPAFCVLLKERKAYAKDYFVNIKPEINKECDMKTNSVKERNSRMSSEEVRHPVLTAFFTKL